MFEINKNKIYTVKDYLKMIDKSERDMFVPFDDIIDPEKIGTATKSLVMCKGVYLKELYEYKKKFPNSHTISCVDKLIDDSDYDLFLSSNISIFLKESRDGDKEYTTAEVAASKLADMFGINTPYIAHVKDNDHLIMSVDFLQKNEKMESFAELAAAKTLGKIHSLSLWIKQLNLMLEQPKFSKITEENKQELLEDLIRAFVVRRFVLMDNDLNSGNMGFVFDPDYTRIKLINFDYEYCFNNNSKIRDMTAAIPPDFMEKNIVWLVQNYPNELKKIVSDVQLDDNKNNFIKDVMKEYRVHPNMQEYWPYAINKNIKSLSVACNDAFKTLDNEREMAD